ncbi:MAG: hypothetical protein IPK44_00565 [Candidatus Accumulibacter sp.]|nr:hypothetical protein [Accumulibacter sp.]
MVRQANAYQVLPGLHANGALAVTENLADVGGIAFAYGALEKYLQAHPEENQVIDGLTQEQRCFLAWGQMWSDKARAGYLRQVTATDAHAPGGYRAYAAARHEPGFYKAFGIRKGDPMWLDPRIVCASGEDRRIMSLHQESRNTELSTSRRKPSVWMGILLYLGYLAVFFSWTINGVDYNRIGENAETTKLWYAFPTLFGCAFLVVAISILGWWRIVSVRQVEIRPPWVWILPVVMVAIILNNFFGMPSGKLSAELVVWSSLGAVESGSAKR